MGNIFGMPGSISVHHNNNCSESFQDFTQIISHFLSINDVQSALHLISNCIIARQTAAAPTAHLDTPNDRNHRRIINTLKAIGNVLYNMAAAHHLNNYMIYYDPYNPSFEILHIPTGMQIHAFTISHFPTAGYHIPW